MAKVLLPYGRTSIPLDTRDHAKTRVYLPAAYRPQDDPLGMAREVLQHPIGCRPLAELIRNKAPKHVVVVVNDETRPTPYHVFFPPLLEVFAECGIRDEQVTFVIATGLHVPHDEELNRKVYGEEMVRRFRFVSHQADDITNIKDFGLLPSGIPLGINRMVAEADFVITLGVVMPHYFAGYSGGRKSILPGVAGHESIERNHARMFEVIDDLPDIHENPISLEMIWAARKVGVDFIFNAVVSDNQEIVCLVGGDLEEAWYAATEVSGSLYQVPFDAHAELCIVSSSGYPRDVNLYQSQKALEHASHIVRRGGQILLLTEAPKGFGDTVFEDWISRGYSPEKVLEEVPRHFVMGGHKAYGFARVAARANLTFVSSMGSQDLQKVWAQKCTDVQKYYDEFISKHPDADIAILPQGSITAPVYRP